MDKIFKNVNYLSVENIEKSKVHAHLFCQDAPARPDLHIEFDESVVCNIGAYGDYEFDELKLIRCNKLKKD